MSQQHAEQHGHHEASDVPASPQSLHPRGDGRDWARRLVGQFNAGHKRPPTVYRFAFEALQLPLPQGVRT